MKQDIWNMNRIVITFSRSVGGTLDISDVSGRVVLLAAWCGVFGGGIGDGNWCLIE